jgi:sulfatase modifying factor 1
MFVFRALVSSLMLGHSESNPPKVIENSIGMKFVLVPAGEFETGSEELAETLAVAVAYPSILSTVYPNLIEVGYTS